MSKFLNPLDGSVDLITLALMEDLHAGDMTTQYFAPETTHCRSQIVARQNAIVSGVETVADVFRRVDPSLSLRIHAREGESVKSGSVVMDIEGSTVSQLAAERTALNFLQRLSGVATHTRTFVDAIEGTKAKILDTRKTTPGFRVLEKAAVRAGGGWNHRMHLGDAMIVKDNHLAALGNIGLQKKIDVIRKDHPDMTVLLEVDTLDQLRAFLKLSGITRILLDNMRLDQLREAVLLTNGKVPLEASGGVHLQTVRSIADTGVDFISVGSLTHSAIAVDFGLDFQSS